MALTTAVMILGRTIRGTAGIGTRVGMTGVPGLPGRADHVLLNPGLRNATITREGTLRMTVSIDGPVSIAEGARMSVPAVASTGVA